ncbi:MAG: hypothetical protein U5K84_12925 [Alkalibacterium sp.]|nr:hypothetical protein [Alkalibacterium sp.]
METKHKAVVVGNNYYIGLSIIRCLGKAGESGSCRGLPEEGCLCAPVSSMSLKNWWVRTIPKRLKNSRIFSLVMRSVRIISRSSIPPADQYVVFMDKYLDELKDYYLINQTEQGF